MTLSVIVPSIDGKVPQSLVKQIAGRRDVELVVVSGVTPVSAARNEGLAKAKGQYIAWVDGDDDVASIWLERILLNLQHQPDILTFDSKVEWHDGSRRAAYCQSHRTNDFVRDYLRGKLPGQFWCKVFRAGLLRGQSFKGMCFEDTRLLCAVLRKSVQSHKKLRIEDIPETLYIYKRRATGLSQYRKMSAVFATLVGLTKECWSLDMAIGISRLWWDFAKTPLRCVIRWKNG